MTVPPPQAILLFRNYVAKCLNRQLLCKTNSNTNDLVSETADAKECLDRGSITGPLDLQSSALPTELSRQFCSVE